MSAVTLKRILYAEDEPDIRTVARMALETLGGFTLEVCSNGQEALERAPDFAPDLILLDVMMPKLDGIATIQALRKVHALAATPVVFMTAKVQPHETQELLDIGAAGVIAKPFDPMTLADNIRQIWTATTSAAGQN